MRRPRRLRRLPTRLLALVALTLCGAVALAACAERSDGRAVASASTPTPVPTKIVARAGDTRLCTVVSPAEFARLAGQQATQVEVGTITDTLTGLREVTCVYVDASNSNQLVGLGTINFELATDADAAARIFAMVKQSFAGVTDINAVGDAAFVGSPGGAGGGTGLVVVKSTLLLYLSIGGTPQTVARSLSQLANLVLARVAT